MVGRLEDDLEARCSPDSNQYGYYFACERACIYRRTFLTATAAGCSALVAGCTSSDESPAETTDDESTAADETTGVVTATLHTSEGDIDVELYGDRAPRTVENFVGLSTGDRTWTDPETGEEVDGQPLYDDILFHRVIDGFMIQTGDPTGTGRGGPGYTFDDEFHEELRHDEAGTLSMANRGPDTNGSQFFITLDAQPHLDDMHSVFGSVTDGMDVVRAIGSVETNANDRPREDVLLESVTVDSS